MVDTFYEKTGELMVRHTDYQLLAAENERLQSLVEWARDELQGGLVDTHEIVIPMELEQLAKQFTERLEAITTGDSGS